MKERNHLLFSQAYLSSIFSLLKCVRGISAKNFLFNLNVGDDRLELQDNVKLNKNLSSADSNSAT